MAAIQGISIGSSEVAGGSAERQAVLGDARMSHITSFGAVLALVIATVATGLITQAMQWPAAARLIFAGWRAISSEAHGGQYADINGVRIWYETYGHGQPVLVLHGGTGSLEDMHYQIRALAAKRLVIAVDSRGHGRSTDSAAPLSYGLMADDMLKLLDVLNIRRADIVGWSDGGIIGLDLAMHHPDRVGRLVVIGANYDVDGLIQKPVPDGPVPPVPGFYARNAPDPAHWPVLYRKVATLWCTEPHYSLADLGKIKAPTLVMAGQFDVIKPEHTNQLAHAIPHAETYIIPGGTHNAVWRKPDIVDDRILAFLNAGTPR